MTAEELINRQAEVNGQIELPAEELEPVTGGAGSSTNERIARGLRHTQVTQMLKDPGLGEKERQRLLEDQEKLRRELIKG